MTEFHRSRGPAERDRLRGVPRGPGVGGSTCGGARSAATSAVVTTRSSQHATAHANSSGHPVIRSFEPGEDWFWNYRTKRVHGGPRLAPPQHHPLDQPVPGPAGRVPANWQDLLVQ